MTPEHLGAPALASLGHIAIVGVGPRLAVTGRKD